MTSCAPGSWVLIPPTPTSDRVCVDMIPTASLNGVSVVQMPINLPTGTLLLSVNATLAAPTTGPLQFTLEPPNDRLMVDSDGDVRLAQVVTHASTITITVVVRDSRAQCRQLLSETTVSVTPGPCEVRLHLVVQTVVFLSCPRDQHVFVPLGEAEGDVHWTEPRLPAFLAGLNVTSTLGDVRSQPADDVYRYGLGWRRVTYATEEPLSFGGRLECSFMVAVLQGVGANVPAIGRVAAPRQVMEYLAVEVDESPAGARLPLFAGHLRAAISRNFSVGFSSSSHVPLAINPKVSWIQ